MSRQQIVLYSVTLIGALALSGCAADAETAPAATSVSAGAPTDSATCAGVNDVLTITANADAGLGDGRMAAQEQQGWYRLATRVLDRVPIRGEGAVSDATAALKAIAPAVELGAMGATGIDSSEWNIGLDELSAACTDADSETAVEMYTGG